MKEYQCLDAYNQYKLYVHEEKKTDYVLDL